MDEEVIILSPTKKRASDTVDDEDGAATASKIAKRDDGAKSVDPPEELAGLRRKVSELETKLEKAEDEIESAKRAARDADMRAEYAESIAGTDVLTSQLEAARARADNAFKSKLDAIHEKDQLREEMSGIRMSFKTKEKDMQNEIARMKDKILDLEDECDRDHRRAKDAEWRLKQEQDSLYNLQRSSDLERAKDQERIDQLTAQASELEEKVRLAEESKEEQERIQIRVAELEAEIARITSENAELQEKYDNLNADMCVMDTERSRFIRDWEQDQERIKELTIVKVHFEKMAAEQAYQQQQQMQMQPNPMAMMAQMMMGGMAAGMMAGGAGGGGGMMPQLALPPIAQPLRRQREQDPPRLPRPPIRDYVKQHQMEEKAREAAEAQAAAWRARKLEKERERQQQEQIDPRAAQTQYTPSVPRISVQQPKEKSPNGRRSAPQPVPPPPLTPTPTGRGRSQQQQHSRSVSVSSGDSPSPAPAGKQPSLEHVQQLIARKDSSHAVQQPHRSPQRKQLPAAAVTPRAPPPPPSTPRPASGASGEQQTTMRPGFRPAFPAVPSEPARPKQSKEQKTSISGPAPNLFALWSQDSPDALASGPATARVRAAIKEHGTKHYEKRAQRREDIRTLVCDRCKKKAEGADIYYHFLSFDHIDEIRTTRSAVSSAAVDFWLALLEEGQNQEVGAGDGARRASGSSISIMEID